MAYFSNGSEGEVLDNECAECVLTDDIPCPILWVQLEYNYEACNNEIASKILNDLIKQKEDGEYVGCKMKQILDKLFKKGS